MKNSMSESFDPSRQKIKFSPKKQIIHVIAEWPFFDEKSQKRAEWFINETGIEKYLRKGGRYLDAGMGKGHIVQRILKDMEDKGEPLEGYYGIDIANKPLEKVQGRERRRIKEKGSQNPMNFVWAASEALPFQERSLDGVSYNFCIHHMLPEKDGDRIKTHLSLIFREAKRVIKKDGYIFIAEDLVDSEEQREFTEYMDRRLNCEGSDVSHHYKSDEEWKEFFSQNGLEVVGEKFFKSEHRGGSVKHGFYVLKLRDGRGEEN